VTQKRKASVEMTKIHLLPSYTNQMFTVLHNNTRSSTKPHWLIPHQSLVI